MIPPTIIVAVVSAALAGSAAFGAAWTYQGNRYELQIEKLKHKETADQLAGANQAVRDMAGFQKGLNDALAKFQATGQVNAAAQRDLDRSLRELRTTTAGLRGDFADLPTRIERAAQPALAEYAAACAAVFEDLAAAGGRMAERGGDIARKAEGHAADARLIQEAWPKKPAK